MPKKETENDHVNMSAYTGGPLGLGDPEDRSMRHVEEHVYITQLIKDRAHHEKCHDLIKSWNLKLALFNRFYNIIMVVFTSIRMGRMYGREQLRA